MEIRDQDQESLPGDLRPLLSIKNVKKRLQFATEHIHKGPKAWSDKTPVEAPMVWGCFTASGVGPLVKIQGIMNGEKYRDILSNNLPGEYADNLPLAWIFQQDNDPKHCCKIVKSWPPQSPAQNPIEKAICGEFYKKN